MTLQSLHLLFFSLPDFSGLVEEALNGTLLNIVQETITGEANITKLLPTIATPQCNNN